MSQSKTLALFAFSIAFRLYVCCQRHVVFKHGNFLASILDIRRKTKFYLPYQFQVLTYLHNCTSTCNCDIFVTKLTVCIEVSLWSSRAHSDWASMVGSCPRWLLAFKWPLWDPPSWCWPSWWSSLGSTSSLSIPRRTSWTGWQWWPSSLSTRRWGHTLT